jgi:dipeptidase E
MRKLFLASTSTVHGSPYLEYISTELKSFFKGVHEILFIPYARPSGISYNRYTKHVHTAFSSINIDVKGIHEFEDPKLAVEHAQGIFIGGGNTFELISKLHENDLMQVLRESVNNGTPYFGTSAGSNVAGISIKTTNDMPVVYPPSFEALRLIGFNLNPHYIDLDLTSTHMGETREIRIKEFHIYNDTPVLGLREGSWLAVNGSQVILKGKLNARLFKQNEEAKELSPESDVSYL